MKLLSLFLAFLLLLPLTQAIRLSPNLRFTVPENSTRSLDIILPDDFGLIPEETEYSLVFQTDWPGVDLTEQTVTTDLNNTVKIPINFPSFGKPLGFCSPYALEITAKGLGSKNWSGEVCVSEFQDVDTGEGERETLDISFQKQWYFSEPGEFLEVKLFISSSRPGTVDVFIKDTGLNVSPFSVRTEVPETRSVVFRVQAPQRKGEYSLEATARLRECEDSCLAKARTILKVGNSPDTGFTLDVIPRNLAVHVNQPVNYTLTIHNFGSDEVFSLYLSSPEGVESSFYSEILDIPRGEEKTLEFVLIPTQPQRSYEIRVGAVSGGVNKFVSLVISTDEILTDLLRETEGIPDPRTREKIQSQIRSQYFQNQSLDVQSLKNLIQEAKKPRPRETPTPEKHPQEETPKPGFNYWFLLVPLVLLSLILLVVYKKRAQTREWEWDYQ